MPIFALDMHALAFPDPELAEPDGLLAIGGDFSPMRMLAAYASGIFPWMVHAGKPVWFSPDPRMVLAPEQLHVPRSLAKIIRRGDYRITNDSAFDTVLERCRAAPRPGQDGSWISRPYMRGLRELHGLGFAHSVEAWDKEGTLVGGLYGLAIGRCFFGESMFADAPDASKVAFATIVHALLAGGYRLVDCQQETAHLARFGAVPIPRRVFVSTVAALVLEHPEAPPWGKPLPAWDGRTSGPPFAPPATVADGRDH
jgi:leucyl/phenylalanyl-tRNA--protein transferase